MSISTDPRQATQNPSHNEVETTTTTAQDSDRTLLIVLPLALAAIGLVLGGTWGLCSYFLSGSGFESEAVVSITRNDSSDNRAAHHAQRVKGKLMVEQCLYRDGGKLRKLTCFDDLREEQIAEHVIRNLIVEPLTDDESIISLRYITPNETDAPTLLNNLVHTYEQSLASSEDRHRRAELARLRWLQGDQRNMVQVQLAKLKELQNKLQPSTDFNSVADKFSDSIIENQKALRSKQHLQEQVNNALAGDSRAKEGMIWMLVERGHLKATGELAFEAEDTPEKDDKKVVEAESDSDDLEKSESDLATLALTRFKSLIEADIALLKTDLEVETNQHAKINDEAFRISEIKEEINDRKSQLEALSAELGSLNRKIKNLEYLQNNSIENEWNFERVQVAGEGKFTRRFALLDIFRPLLIATFAGLSIGMLFSFILK